MLARAKNNIAAFVVGFPIIAYFPVSTWQFWFIGLVGFEMFYLATAALPIFVDRLPRKDGR